MFKWNLGGYVMDQEKLENLIIGIRKENPENKISFTYGGGDKIQLDSEIKINDGILTIYNINDGTIRYIDVESIYEVILDNKK